MAFGRDLLSSGVRTQATWVFDSTCNDVGCLPVRVIPSPPAISKGGITLGKVWMVSTKGAPPSPPHESPEDARGPMTELFECLRCFVCERKLCHSSHPNSRGLSRGAVVTSPPSGTQQVASEFSRVERSHRLTSRTRSPTVRFSPLDHPGRGVAPPWQTLLVQALSRRRHAAAACPFRLRFFCDFAQWCLQEGSLLCKYYIFPQIVVHSRRGRSAVAPAGLADVPFPCHLVRYWRTLDSARHRLDGPQGLCLDSSTRALVRIQIIRAKTRRICGVGVRAMLPLVQGHIGHGIHTTRMWLWPGRQEESVREWPWRA